MYAANVKVVLLLPLAIMKMVLPSLILCLMRKSPSIYCNIGDLNTVADVAEVTAIDTGDIGIGEAKEVTVNN